MNDQTIVEEDKPEEIIFAEQLIKENKYTEALKVLREYIKKNNVPLYYKVYSLNYIARLLMYVGKHEECLKISEKAYNESLNLGKNLITVETLNLRALVNNWQGNMDKSYELIKKSEELFNTFTIESSADYIRTEANLNFIKGFLISRKDVDKGLEYLNYSLSLWDKIDLSIGKAMTIMCIGLTHYYSKGELDKSIGYFEQGLRIAEKLNHKYGIAFLLNHLGSSYLYKGELNRSLDYYQKALKLFEEINNKSFGARTYALIGNIMGEKGRYDEAFKDIEKSIGIYREIGELYELFSPLGIAIELSLYKGDNYLANEYLEKLKRIKDRYTNTIINLWVIFYDALILKRSSRTRDKAKAEELLLTLLEKVKANFGLKIEILVQLCEIYLTELEVTNNLEVLNDINPLIDRLLEIAKNSHSHFILCETYILQAKLALIILEVKEARKYLTKAQQIAKKYGMNQLAIKISNEHDELLKQLSTWENLQNFNAPIAERIKLTRLGDQIKSMLHKHVDESIVVSEENPVVILITSKAGTPIFSKSFIDEFSFKDHLWSGFLTAFNSFSDEMLSEGLDRAKFGEYNLLLRTVTPFLVCYLFKGQSYFAQYKLQNFIEKITGNSMIWKIFNKFYQTNQEIQLKDIPILEKLLNESFLSSYTLES
ncbi:MAG: tetratricopeptide repeat protein [Promethearchaeota archaeon]